jgi:hypothetical protein
VILYAVILLSALVYIEDKQKKASTVKSPDLERLLSIHPDEWTEVKTNIDREKLKKSIYLEYDDIAEKRYINKEGDIISIVMTWSRNGIQRAGHIQQLCYTTQGYSIIDPKDVNLDISNRKIKMTKFTAKNLDGDIEDVLYWRITGKEIMKNTSDVEYGDYRLMHRVMKMKKLMLSIFRDIPDNIMVRVTAKRKDAKGNDNINVDYAKKYLEKLSVEDRKILVGF